MWNIAKIGDTIVYQQRNGDCLYEVHHSKKLELIVRNAATFSTHYFRFQGKDAKDSNDAYIDESLVERTVNSIPNLSELPEDITRALLAVKKIKKEIPVQPDQS